MELFLGILATIGFVLLIILAVFAGLIALVLFLPIVYRVKIQKSDELNINGSVRWLFGALWVRFGYENKEFQWSIRFFGYPVDRLLKGEKKKDKKDGASGSKAKKDEYAPAKKQPTIAPGQRQAEAETEAERLAKEPEKRLEDAYNGGKIRELSDSEAFEEETKTPILEKIRLTFRKIRGILDKAGEFIALFQQIKPILWKLLKHIRPRKIDGFVEFGFEDPSTTGIVCGIIGMLPLPIPKKLQLIPDFQEAKLICDVNIMGRMFMIVLLINLIRLLRIEGVRKMLRDILPGKKHRKKRKGRRKKGRKRKKNTGGKKNG